MYKTTEGTHDPTIIYNQKDKTYYMYSTDTSLNGEMTHGCQIRKSRDLKTWEYIGTALDGMPDSVFIYTNPTNLWAPEVLLDGDTYYMYYSASIFGTNESCINLAEAKSPVGPWIDRGLVIKSHPETDEHNAIDANVLYDKDGKLWMTYGSFFSGIYVVELDPKTHKLKDKNDIGTRIAHRAINVEGAIEGPFIYYHQEQDMYYLFTSYDFLGNTYNIRVARSKEITGPYLDYLNQTMFGNVDRPHINGTKILGSHNLSFERNWTSIGHNSILDVDDKQYLVAHTRVDHQGWPHYTYIRQIAWLKSGWPVVMLGEVISEINEDIPKRIHAIIFDPENLKSIEEKEIEIKDTWDIQAYITNLDKERIAVSGIMENGQVFFGYEKGIDE